VHRKVPAWFGPGAVGKGAAHSGNLANGLPVLVAAMRDLTHAELAGEAVRALAEALAAVAPDFLAETVDLTVWAKRYGPRACDWNWPRAKAERDGLAEQFGRDGRDLLTAIFAQQHRPWLRELPQVALLCTVLRHNYLIETGKNGSEVMRRRTDTDGVPPAPLRLASPQMARNALMDLAEHTEHFKFLIRDHGPQFTTGVDAVFHAAGIRIVTTGIQAPVMNAIQERWHRTVRAEVLDRTLIWNLVHLRRVLAEYESFYDGHRPHRALGQAAPLRPLPDNVIDLEYFRIARRDRIGGILHEYHLVA